MTETKVKFLQDWKFAHGGHAIVAYKAGEKCSLSEEALDAAIEDGVIELNEGKAPPKDDAEDPAVSEADKKKVNK